MREIALFVEDLAHRLVIGRLVERLARDRDIRARLNWISSEGGYGQVVYEFRAFLRNLVRRGGPLPDLIIIASDSNCIGLNQRVREITAMAESVGALTPPIITAVPDPHIERWLLLDGAAFARVVGRGCDAPDQKCNRDRYKDLLAQAVLDAGNPPNLGGIEFADDIVAEMDIERAKRSDDSLRHFLDSLDAQFRQWSQ